MSGFSNLDETQSQTNVAFSTTNLRQRLDSIKLTWNTRTTLEKGLLIAVVGLSVLALGLIIGLAVARGKGSDKSNEPSPSPEVCLTPDCTTAASRILESLDRSVNPCSDFYAYACGTWKKTNAIPDDSTEISVFSILGEKIQYINKNMYENPNNVGAKEHAWRKAKDVYSSCMDTDVLEQKNLSVIIPVLEALGGWPVLGANPGGHWDERRFDLSALLVKLAQYGIHPLIKLEVSLDDKHSTQRILQLEQPTLGVPFNLRAYLTYAKSMASLFGADPFQAEIDMIEMLELQEGLNNIKVSGERLKAIYALVFMIIEKITMSEEDLKNPDVTYNKMTLAEIRTKFTEPRRTNPIQFSWSNYVRGIMGADDIKVIITDSEPVIVKTIPYFQRLFGVLQQYSKRTIVNFIIWFFMENSQMSLALPARFRELNNRMLKNSGGATTPQARWRQCESLVTQYMGLAISQKYISNEFDDTTRERAAEMIKNIRIAFDELLQEVEWMDENTRRLAKEKAEAIKNRIGYSDEIVNVTFINRMYEKTLVDKTELLGNMLNCLKTSTATNMKLLREPFNKAMIWSMMLPTTINAAYAWPLNDMSRKYDKYGNLKQWWDQKIIDNFNKQAKCMVNQYSSYVVPEVYLTINGNLTLGENIADNGGLKQSYRAYRRWVLDQGKEEPRLPGLDLTNNQLFFVRFAQNWCENVIGQSLLAQVFDEHTPAPFRVIGTLQNSEEFAAAFSCPIKTYMNPENKCSVW